MTLLDPDLVLQALEPFGAAVRAYYEGDEAATLQLRWDLGGEVEVPVEIYFAAPGDGPPVEREALARLSGDVLDLGAGSGRFALAAMERGHAVTAVEMLPDAVRVLEGRGIPWVRGDFVADPSPAPADTVLLLMNGSTHADTLAGLPRLLRRLGTLTRPAGKILIDSTDPAHPAVDWDEPGDGRAAGELHLQIGFRGTWGPPLPQLFVAPGTLADAAAAEGLRCEVVRTDDDGRYLAELRALAAAARRR